MGRGADSGANRRKRDAWGPCRPRFRRLSEGIASRPFGHQKRPNMSARLQSDHNVPKNDRLWSNKAVFDHNGPNNGTLWSLRSKIHRATTSCWALAPNLLSNSALWKVTAPRGAQLNGALTRHTWFLQPNKWRRQNTTGFHKSLSYYLKRIILILFPKTLILPLYFSQILIA